MALPFPLPSISRGFASLTPGAREVGQRSAESASRSLSELLGTDVSVVGAAVPVAPAPAVGMARIGVSLEALPAAAVLEVEVRLLAHVVEHLAGSTTRTPGALTPSEVEQSLFELMALGALDAIRSPAVDALVPRLCAGCAAPPDALVVALELSAGGAVGRGRLLLPPAAVAALRDLPELSEELAALAVLASWRDATVSLSGEELAALGPGDVLLLDEGGPRAEVVLPGGLAVRGPLDGEQLHVEEIQMTETQAAYPLTLSVEIARVSVTLGELARLEVGAALPLPATKDGAVVLRAGERAIARGELVDVDGALGVRLTQVGGAP